MRVIKPNHFLFIFFSFFTYTSINAQIDSENKLNWAVDEEMSKVDPIEQAETDSEDAYFDSYYYTNRINRFNRRTIGFLFYASPYYNFNSENLIFFYSWSGFLYAGSPFAGFTRNCLGGQNNGWGKL